MSSWKNSMNQRKYRERSQLQERQHLGHLEKKKDYKKRAENYHQKKKNIDNLRQKARLKNEDEFYFKMQNARQTEDGKVEMLESEDSDFDEKEYTKIIKNQNQNLVKLQRTKDQKSINELKQSLQMLDMKKQNQKIIFVNSKEELDNYRTEVNTAQLIDENNIEDIFDQNEEQNVRKIGEKMKNQYKKLSDKLTNKNKLDQFYKKNEYEKNLLSKESRKIKKYKGQEYHRFFMERKR